MEANQQLLRIGEAAQYVGLTKGSLYHLVRKDQIPYHKPAKYLLFNKQDLSTWLTKTPQQKVNININENA